ncbi:DUF927 domain-containing protein [Mesosutterella sp. OilRF-GAM-744-9]|uniref:DUF927 domain-containing protein n=1 Tax=Mesosutterella porci TaxID=2915351 RepID=A0ABS9MT87_9BURK|nr:DUF927 domain-containing protein [Mesosutterella sp. oilRF-744-WT-GAM-9]MCG5031840.1 DUF927 domain-containing protein [Mesosutterella sp. oilRF-744-WT-GAM-9]
MLSEKTKKKLLSEAPDETAPAVQEGRAFPKIEINGHEFVPRDGAYWLHQSKDADEDKDIKLCSLIRVTAKYSSKDGLTRGLIIEVIDEDENAVQLVLGMDVINDLSALIKRLSNAGLRIFAGSRQNGRGLISELISNFPTANIERLRGVSVNGWIKPGYCYVRPGGEVIGKLPTGQKVISLGHDYPDDSKGTLEGWKRNAALPGLKSSRIMTALGVSFAGALLALINMSSRGIHFYGTSTTGKSVTATVGCSVWGTSKNAAEPGSGHFGSWNTSSAGVEAHFRRNSSSVSALDELHLAGRLIRDLKDVSLFFGNEQPRGRGTPDATLRKQSGWRETLISTGEKPVYEILIENGCNGQSAGAERRLTGVNAIVPGSRDIFEPGYFPSFDDSFKFVNRLAEITETEQYGTAGPAFIRKIIELYQKEGPAALPEKVKAFRDEARSRFIPRIDPSMVAGQQLNEVFVGFEVYYAALKLAREFEVLPPEYTDEAIGAAIHSCAESAAESFRGSDWQMRNYAQQILDALVQKGGHFIQRYETGTRDDITGAVMENFTPDEKTEVYGCIRGFHKGSEDETAYFIKSAFSKYVIPGHMADSVARMLPRSCYAGNMAPSSIKNKEERMRKKWLYKSPKPLDGLEAGVRYLALNVSELKKIAG